MIVGIIGAGAAGMAAALAAAENDKVQVVLVERQARVGRKLQATGNGRCNLSNLHALKTGYHGDHADFAQSALTQMGPVETLAWFARLGLLTVAEPSGKVYPYSDQANSVVDVLRLALRKSNITLRTGFEVNRIIREDGMFAVNNGEETIKCDRVIIACGGLAGTKLGGSMSGYKLLGKLGHKSTRLRPSLVQLKSNWGGLASLKGVRCNCHAEILRDGQTFAQSTGEIRYPTILSRARLACWASTKFISISFAFFKDSLTAVLVISLKVIR